MDDDTVLDRFDRAAVKNWAVKNLGLGKLRPKRPNLVPYVPYGGYEYNEEYDGIRQLQTNNTSYRPLRRAQLPLRFGEPRGSGKDVNVPKRHRPLNRAEKLQQLKAKKVIAGRLKKMNNKKMEPTPPEVTILNSSQPNNIADLSHQNNPLSGNNHTSVNGFNGSKGSNLSHIEV